MEKRFTTSIPVFSVNMKTKKQRETVLSELRRARADRVFLCVNRHFDGKELEEECAILKENVAYFSSHGIEAAIWVGSTIGHGVPLSHDEKGVGNSRFTDIVSLSGKTMYEAFCPLDENFSRAIEKNISAYAKCGAKTILIDDDFRLTLHSDDFFCFCPLHLARMEKILGKKVDRDMLAPYIKSGKKNEYRDAWLAVQREAILGLAKKMRAAVDEVDPSIRLASCSSFSSWGTDGFLAPELSRIFAGGNRPLMRLFGAPYWAIEGPTPMPSVFETVRAHDALTGNEDIEKLCECDVYPRPRQNCPAAYLMIYDAFVRSACNLDGTLNYMLDYTSTATYETGYIDRYERALPLHEKLGEFFDFKEAVGVRIYDIPDKYRGADLCVYETAPSPKDMSKMTCPKGASMLARLSIPTTYAGDGICPMICGEDARYIDLAVIEKGAILDGLAAMILSERGVDVGIKFNGKFKIKESGFEVYPEYGEKIMLRDSAAYYPDIELSPAAKVLSLCDDMPTACAFENEKGARFLIYTFDMMSLSRTSSLCNSYARHRQLFEYTEWISTKKLPAFCPKNPDLYILCKKDEDSMAVGLFNCFADEVFEPKITLDEKYRDIEFLGCTGVLEGDTVKLSTISPFGYAAFKVK